MSQSKNSDNRNRRHGRPASGAGRRDRRHAANRNSNASRAAAKPASKLTPARQAAVEIVAQVRERDAYARELIDARRAGWPHSQEDFDYMQVLVFGVVMCRGSLDDLINRNLKSPKDIKDDVRDALRISAYELVYLHKPDHVVVDQGVEMARFVARKAAGLANAVLRKMAADAKDFPWGDKDTDHVAFARYYGVQQWFCDTLLMQYGIQQTEDLLAAFLKSAPTYTVDNPYLPGTKFAADLASQQVASMVPVDGSILEIGAGRGTKTMLMQRNAYAWYREPAVIHAVDVHQFKADLLSERMAEQHVPGVFTHVGDACDLDSIEDLPRAFDAVFIDAPCSGTGTLRRHPEIRWNLKKRDVSALAAIQLDMLKSAASYVKPSGVMVYATCSILRRENEEVVASFLKSEQGRGFSIVECTPAFEEFEDFITDAGFFASLPAVDGPDGHFAVILRRE